MTRSLPVLAVVVLAGCTAALGGPKKIPMTTVALRAEATATPGAVAGALEDGGARVAFLAAPAEEAWFRSVAGAVGLELTGPAQLGDLAVAFLAPEPVGDTIHTVEYDGGSFELLDALYQIEEERFLDLIAFRITDPAHTRPAVRSLLEYVATDVSNAAALVMAVAVPSAAVGDSVARMLAPAYYDAIRCEPGLAAQAERGGMRLFYGPEARMFCTDAAAETRPLGDWIRAKLVMGRR